MKITTEARSDQINAQDLIGSPRTFTIAGVGDGKAEQKYDVKLEGEARVWRPPLTVLRLLKKCWGDDGDDWAGKRVVLYCDEAVSFGKEKTGGIRVSHASGIDKPVTASLQVSRGKYQTVTVQPLKEAAPKPAMISREQWEQISALHPDEPLAWASGELKRPLTDPREITAQEAEHLTNTLNNTKENA